MPALPADIAAGTRAAQIETWSSTAIHARYPNARDDSDKPADGYFDLAIDADTVITARGALIGTERRRLSAVVSGLIWPDPSTGVPTFTIKDAYQSVNGPGLASRIEVDLEDETTSYEVLV